MMPMVKLNNFCYIINKKKFFFQDNFSFRLDDTLSRSLKIKLKQRRDKIEQSESVNRIVL